MIKGSVARITRLTSLFIIGISAIVFPSAGTGFAWGPEGHKAIAVLAGQYMRPETMGQVHELLGSESIEDASVWADEIRESARPDTASWHFINIPLRDSQIDLHRDCPGGECVLVKTEEFLSILGDPHAAAEARREALKFVIHFVGDLHQPLHCEDHGDLGGNQQRVIFENQPENLHWVWDSGLVQEISSDPRRLVATLASKITAQERTSWQVRDISAWVLESHRVAQTAYRRSWLFGSPALSGDYDDRAKTVIELQLEKAAVRLAYLLNERLN